MNSVGGCHGFKERHVIHIVHDNCFGEDMDDFIEEEDREYSRK